MLSATNSSNAHGRCMNTMGRVCSSGLNNLFWHAAVSEWITKQNVFPGRIKTNSGYNWTLTHKGLTRSLNACHLTFGLAYLHAKAGPQHLVWWLTSHSPSTNYNPESCATVSHCDSSLS